jgi:ABC-2 type transport system ATP-binding protein
VSAAAVSIQHVRKQYRSRVALDDLSLAACGGVVTLLGPNGAGKTTLLRALATVLAVDAGTIHVDGLDPRMPDQRVAIRSRLGYLPQDPGFARTARVFDVLDYLGIVKGLSVPRRRHVEVRRVLEVVGLASVAQQKVKTLSGGMVRRLGIAQALMGDPTLVVLDEPAAGLDPQQRLLLRERLSTLGERATVFLSTHLTDEAAAFSQHLVVMDHGRVLFDGTPAALTATAAGSVWRTEAAPAATPIAAAPAWDGILPERSPQPQGPAATGLTWRTPEGWYRTIGAPPPGAVAAPPTLEDAYLLLVARSAPSPSGPATTPGPWP